MSYEPPRDPPASPGAVPGEAATLPPSKKKKRSGSEKRRRSVMNKFRSTAAERAEMQAHAKAIGLTFGAFMRSLGCTEPTTRIVRRRLPELQPYMQTFGKANIAASNLAQFLRAMNHGELEDIPELRHAAANLDAFIDELLAIVRGYAG